MVVVNREILVSLTRTLLAGTNLDKISEKKSAEQFSKSIETYDAVTSWAVKSVTAVKKTTIVNYRVILNYWHDFENSSHIVHDYFYQTCSRIHDFGSLENICQRNRRKKYFSRILFFTWQLREYLSTLYGNCQGWKRQSGQKSFFDELTKNISSVHVVSLDIVKVTGNKNQTQVFGCSRRAMGEHRLSREDFYCYARNTLRSSPVDTKLTKTSRNGK